MAQTAAFCLLFFFTAVLVDAQSSARSCFDDEVTCLQNFRSLLNDRDRFWFGTRFSQTCSSAASFSSFGSVDQKCLNPSTGQTLLSRLLPTYSDSQRQSVASTARLADVSYTGESRPHFSCGHQFSGTPRLTIPLRLDPLHTTTWPQAQVDTTPTVTWPRLSNSVYHTVLVLDIGYLFPHGIYINAQNTMTDGQAVYPYSGPKNPNPGRTNAFIFVVIPQPSGQLDYATVQQTVYGLLGSGVGLFNFTQFANTFNFGFNELSQSAMNVMDVVGDVYGAQYIKEQGFGDNCPNFVSKNPYLNRATSWAQLPSNSAWSDATTVTSPDTRDVTLPYLTSLTAGLEVTFNTDDIMFESCCTYETYIRAQLTPDPYKTPTEDTERPVQLRNAPRVYLTPMTSDRRTLAGKTYTLMLVDFGNDFQDFSADAPADPAFIIHWLVTNISGADVTTGREAVPYFGSNPFSRNSPRMYTFLLLEQTTQFNVNTLRNYVRGDCGSFPQRCQYRVNRLMSDWGITDIRGVTFYFAEQDSFARQRIYRTWAVKDKHTVCTGVPGYNPWAWMWKWYSSYYH